MDSFLKPTTSQTSSTSDGARSDTPEESTSLSNVSNPWPYLEIFFKFVGVKNRDNLEFDCLLCKPTTKRLSTNIKSQCNLKKHINRMHPHALVQFQKCIDERSKPSKRKEPLEISSEPKEKRQLSLKELSHSGSSKVSQSLFEEKLVNVFVENMLPLEIVESSSVRDFIETCVPGKSTLSRRTLTRRIETRYISAKSNLDKVLENVSLVATTADAWTCRNKSFLGVTVHWIDPETLVRKKAVLACRRMIGRHTFDVIAQKLHEINCEFRIESKIAKTTTDNGSNFVKAFNIFGKSDTEDYSGDSQFEAEQNLELEDADLIIHELEPLLEESGAADYDLPKHARCAAHTLNLVATTDADMTLTQCNKFKKAYRTAFAKAKELWNRQSRSSNASDVIKAEVGVLLTVPNSTRWNSVFDAVVRLVEIFGSRDRHSGLNRACSKLNLPVFTQGDISFFKEYQMVMKPVSQSLDVLQGEDKAYMGVLLPSLTMCLKKLKEVREQVTVSVCEPLLDVMTKAIEKRFGHLFDDMGCLLAAATHPQFKLFWLGWLPEELPYNPNEMRQNVEKKMTSLLENRLEDNSRSNSDHDDELKDDFFEPFITHEGKSITASKLVSEFLEGKPRSINTETFPCKELKEIFVIYNTPIPSSAAVERLFSVGKDILKPKRAVLSDEHFQMLVFLKGNYGCTA